MAIKSLENWKEIRNSAKFQGRNSWRNESITLKHELEQQLSTTKQ
jgi:hypothetical protein